MTGVLILAHGSRQKETENTVLQLLEMIKEEIDVELIQHAFLQLADNNLEAGLRSLIKQGATDIVVIPYFLFDGVHALKNIPDEINDFLKENPGVNIKFGRTLGADVRLARIMADRIKEMLE